MNWQLPRGRFGFADQHRERRCAVSLIILLSTYLLPVELRGQDESVIPALGDIIEYRQPSGKKYGLVVNVAEVMATVESFAADGELETDRVFYTPTTEIRIVDSLNKKTTAAIRIWKSADGKSEIEARMLRVEGDRVRLEKADGKTIAVEISKLSDDDRNYIDSGDSQESTSENPFEAAESDDFPEDVIRLMDRRRELVQEQDRHQRLAKLNPNLMVGDIIKFEKFPRGFSYGIVTSTDRLGSIETVDENGEIEIERGIGSRGRWGFIDREFATPPLAERSWGSTSGKFNVIARMTEIDGDKVVLQKQNGETVKVEVSRLSAVDQNYIKRNRGKLSVANDEQLAQERESYGPELQTLLARRNELFKREAANSLTAADASKMKSIRLRTGPIELSPQQLKPLSFGEEVYSLSFQLRMPENAGVKQVCYSKQSGLLALAANSPFDGKPTLAVVNVENQQVVTNIDSDDVGHDGQVIALSPSGRVLIVYSGDSSDNQLELWRHENQSLTRQSVISYESFSAPTAFLFSDQQGVILSSDGKLAFFDVGDRIIPTHQVAAGRFANNSQIQIADDLKSILYFDSSASALYVIDVETKVCVGGLQFRQPEGGIPTSYAQVNGDGKTAFLIDRSRLTVYSLETGKSVADQVLPAKVGLATAGSGQFQYLGPNLILAYDGSLIDLKLGMEIGSVELKFTRSANAFADAAKIFVEIKNRSSGAGGFGGLNAVRQSASGRPKSPRDVFRNKVKYVEALVNVIFQRLPVDEIVAHAESLSEADIVDFGSGDKLQLKFKVNDPRLEDQLHAKIKTEMAKAGIEIAESSDYVLELLYSVGKPQTETYQIIGDITPRSRNVTITPKSCSATLSYRGEKIWSRSESASLGRPRDESDLDASLQKAQRLSAQTLLEFSYPSQLRVISPGKRRNFRWQ